MNTELERDMWKQRAKNLMLLLLEAQERLDGTLPGHKAADVAQWISEIISDDCWVEEIKRMPSLPHSRLIRIDEAMSAKKDWRAFYANRMNTFPDHVRYWWELTQKLQEDARILFSNVNMEEHVYDIWSGDRILRRRLKDTADNTEEIPF